MKLFYPLFFAGLILLSCSTSKDYMSRIDEDKTLFDAVRALGKHADDSLAAKALPALYAHAQEKHLKKIGSLGNSTELSRWDKIITEYGILQKMYEAIVQTDAARRLVVPIDYQTILGEKRNMAAEEYYLAAESLLSRGNKTDARTAYGYFKRSDKLMPGYKQSRSRMDEAYQAAIVDVLINPVADRTFFFNNSWGNYGTNYSNEYFQQTLIRELGGVNANRYPARFYTEWDLGRNRVVPDLVVNLTLRNLDIPRPSTQNYSRNNSRQISVGKDSSGRDIYQTVYATVNIARSSFTARVEMEVNITDASTRKSVSTNTYREDYSWQEENASYTGDQRALSDQDWNLVNNRRFDEPRKEDVLNELYRRIYPQVKNRIANVVSW